ncbi:hypothetical protein ACIPC1_22920 [Streptomyces sp. NPDC087263]|uniref:hypothetical protein n=1 Tax=Streptomyces sp. NPDC087263 TaxID=3365773 RepID=UPI003802B0B1
MEFPWVAAPPSPCWSSCAARAGPDLSLAVRRAVALAVRPSAGPVFLAVPMDVLTEDHRGRKPLVEPVGSGLTP